ncbi:MAG: uracil-DNA glycosylase [Spirochaetes bacterium]|nr:uracil-DNA glycosylase [Spirochaetota bacterium]
MGDRKIQLGEGWLRELAPEFETPPMERLRAFLVEEMKKGPVYPPGPLIFNAFNTTPWEKVRAVILGQDPYHGPDQAHGLCFSVRRGIRHPPSLRNIFQELSDDLSIPPPISGDLTPWAEQGVLLLNSVLTVRAHQAQSHANRGWEAFTDRVIEILNEKKEHLVFLLWGGPAQNKAHTIDPRRHLVLKSPHPSPLSAHRGFFGCRHFSIANEYLASHGLGTIDWRLD